MSELYERLAAIRERVEAAHKSDWHSDVTGAILTYDRHQKLNAVPA